MHTVCVLCSQALECAILSINTSKDKVIHFSGLVNGKCQSKKRERDFIGHTRTIEKDKILVYKRI